MIVGSALFTAAMAFMISLKRSGALKRIRGVARRRSSVQAWGAITESKEIAVNGFDWGLVSDFWRRIIDKERDPPAWVQGDDTYGLSNIRKLGEVGEFSGEFDKKGSDARYGLKKTFAIVFGYRGSEYERGYARQRVKHGEEERTVELDIKNSLRLGSQIVVAGRTDKHVSAISQVINIVTTGEITSEEIMQRLRDGEPAQSGRVVFYDCVRAPRSFNTRGCATWRRYLYLVPLEGPVAAKLDVAYVDKVFGHLEGKELGFNAFAFGEMRNKGNGMLDLCTLYRGRAFEVEVPLEGREESVKAMCVELVGTRFLRRMVRLLVATAVREALKPVGHRDHTIIEKICNSGDRALTAYPFPGSGLAFAGCGFDYRDLAYFKFISKVNRARLDAAYEEGNGIE